MSGAVVVLSFEGSNNVYNVLLLLRVRQWQQMEQGEAMPSCTVARSKLHSNYYSWCWSSNALLQDTMAIGNALSLPCRDHPVRGHSDGALHCEAAMAKGGDGLVKQQSLCFSVQLKQGLGNWKWNENNVQAHNSPNDNWVEGNSSELIRYSFVIPSMLSLPCINWQHAL